MKKVIALCLSVLLVFGVFAGCGSKDKTEPTAPPVIKLSVSDTDLKTDYVKSYKIPTAEARSVVDKKKKLEVKVKCFAPDGKDVAVNAGAIAPSGIGKYKITYNATDLNGTAAKEAVVNVEFIDGGIIVTPKRDAVTAIHEFKDFKVPEFTEVASAEYPLKDMTMKDFNVEVSAEHKILETAAQGTPIDVSATQRYKTGVISITYTLTAKSDAKITKSYVHKVRVGNVLMQEFVGRGAGMEATLTETTDPAIKAEGSFIAVDFSKTQWSGMALLAPSDVLDELNSRPNDYFVLRAYNPTQYFAKAYMTVYDDGVYAPKASQDKDGYGYCMIAKPHEYFNFVVSMSHLGKISKIDFNMEATPVPADVPELQLGEGELQKEFVTGYYCCDEMYILDYGVYTEDELSTSVLKTESAQDVEKLQKTGNGVVAFYENTDAETQVTTKGVRVTQTGAEDKTSLNLVGQDENIEKLLLQSRSRYNNLFAFDVINLGETEALVYAELGAEGKNMAGDAPYYTNRHTIAAKDSLTLYYSGANREDRAKLMDWDHLSLVAEGKADVVFTNFRIVETNAFNKAPNEKFAITEAEGASQFKLTGGKSDYAIPGFENLFVTNFPATAKLIGVMRYEQADYSGVAQPVTVTDNKIAAIEDGYYRLTFAVTEKATGEECTANFDFRAISTVEEKATVQKVYYTRDVRTLSFDDLFDCAGEHTAVLTKIERTVDGKPASCDIDVSSAKKIEFTAGADVYGTYTLTFELTRNSGKSTHTFTFDAYETMVRAEDFGTRAIGADHFRATDTVTDGLAGVRFHLQELWSGADSRANIPAVAEYNAKGAGHILSYYIKNSSSVEVRINNFIDGAESGAFAQKFYLKPGEVSVVFYEYDVVGKISNLNFWVDTNDAEVKTFEIDLFDVRVSAEAEVAVPVFDFSQVEQLQTALQNGSKASTVTVDAANQKITVQDTGAAWEGIFDFLAGDLNGVLHNYYAKGDLRRLNAFAFDFNKKAETAADHSAIGMCVAREPNSNGGYGDLRGEGGAYWFDTDNPCTRYVTYSQFIDAARTAEDLKWIALNSSGGKTYEISNVRVLNFARVQPQTPAV